VCFVFHFELILTTGTHHSTTELPAIPLVYCIFSLTGVFNAWVSIAAFGAICLAIWFGGKLVFEGELSVGILTSFLVYTVQIAASLAVISSLYGEFMQVCIHHLLFQLQ